MLLSELKRTAMITYIATSLVLCRPQKSASVMTAQHAHRKAKLRQFLTLQDTQLLKEYLHRLEGWLGDYWLLF